MLKGFFKENQKLTLFCILILTVFLILPFWNQTKDSYIIVFLYTTFLYVVASQGWNLVAGYAGQMSLGSHAFFGIGAYITALTWKAGWVGYLDPMGLVISGIGAAVLAVLIGIPLLSKLRGDYFALGTLGLGEILRVVINNGGEFTGGPIGVMLPSSQYEAMRPYYLFALAIMLVTLVAVYAIIRSNIGLALEAIRDDEMAASTFGIAVLRYKVFAFAVGAFFTGMAGSISAYYMFHIHPAGVFSLSWALYPILMTVLGGVGTFWGPVIGAVLLSIIFEVANILMPEFHTLVSSASIIVITLFLTKGVINISLGSRTASK